MPLELTRYSNLSWHIKEPQNGYCLNFLKKLHNLKCKTLFHNKNNLHFLVCLNIVRVLFSSWCIFFTVREHDVWCKSDMVFQTKQWWLGGWGLREGSILTITQLWKSPNCEIKWCSYPFYIFIPWQKQASVVSGTDGVLKIGQKLNFRSCDYLKLKVNCYQKSKYKVF